MNLNDLDPLTLDEMDKLSLYVLELEKLEMLAAVQGNKKLPISLSEKLVQMCKDTGVDFSVFIEDEKDGLSINNASKIINGLYYIDKGWQIYFANQSKIDSLIQSIIEYANNGFGG